MRFPSFLSKMLLIALPHGYRDTGENQRTVQEKRAAVGATSARYPKASRKDKPEV